MTRSPAARPGGAQPPVSDQITRRRPTSSIDDSSLSVTCERPLLIVRFATEHAVASWAIIRGGLRRASAVVWYETNERELRPPAKATEILQARLDGAGLHDAVGLMTSRRVDSYSETEVSHGEVSAQCIATVGLGNALRVGDLPGSSGRIGTINLLCRVSTSLTPEAQLEALSLAAEARTLAVMQGNVPSRRSGRTSTGTGTDCTVIASPLSPRMIGYAGKHTAVGYAVGAAVSAAVRDGVARWLREQR